MPESTPITRSRVTRATAGSIPKMPSPLSTPEPKAKLPKTVEVPQKITESVTQPVKVVTPPVKVAPTLPAKPATSTKKGTKSKPQPKATASKKLSNQMNKELEKLHLLNNFIFDLFL